MTTSNPNPPEALRGEILAEARSEADEILRNARREAEALLAKAQAEADQNRDARLALARSEAAHRREMLLATVSTEAGQLRSAAVERLLQSIRDEARQRLLAHEGIDYSEVLAGLAGEAISQMAGATFVVKIASAEGAAPGKTLAAKLAQRFPQAAITVTEDSAIAGGGGVIIQDAGGRQVWDNRLAARLERLWPELRRQIAVQTGLASATSAKGGGA
jgi:vacuolar-type H+-ATPase subunit E/Vma4